MGKNPSSLSIRVKIYLNYVTVVYLVLLVATLTADGGALTAYLGPTNYSVGYLLLHEGVIQSTVCFGSSSK
jgi:hypothetical protein